MIQLGMGIDPVTATFIIAGFNTGLGLLLNRKSGMQKEQATVIVDEAEVQFKRMVHEWQNLPNRTRELKQFYLAETLKGMDQVKKFLLNPQLGDHGLRAVQERFGSYDPLTGQGVRGSTWDWWSYYWDPIANTEVVGGEVTNQQLAQSIGQGNAGQGVSFGNMGIWPLVFAGVGVYFLMRK